MDLIYLDPPFNSNVVYNLPFDKKNKRDFEAVAAFEDTWTWETQEQSLYEELKTSGKDDEDLFLVKIVGFALDLRGKKGSDNIAAYLLNMGVRLKSLKRILKPTGSIWLHCDPTASHYLKILMDVIFGFEFYKNEIIWGYTGPSNTKYKFPSKHDVLLFYTKGKMGVFNKEDTRISHTRATGTGRTSMASKNTKPEDFEKLEQQWESIGKPVESHWADIDVEIEDIGNYWTDIGAGSHIPKQERLGFPTQKPVKLLKRIIESCTNENDLVLDPFCGCGTTLHAAESLERRWIGIDISRYSASLVKHRILDKKNKFKNKQNQLLDQNDITTYGLPTTVEEARALVIEIDGRFEFEKWVCGVLGTSDMMQRKKPGKRGADGGVDGLLMFFPFKKLEDVTTQPIAEDAYAVIQVKSGKVTPDAVRALTQVIDETPGAIAAVLVAFEDQRRTFDNNASKDVIPGIEEDSNGIAYRKVQFVSIEQILSSEQNPVHLPNIRKMGGKSETVKMPKTEKIDSNGTLDLQ